MVDNVHVDSLQNFPGVTSRALTYPVVNDLDCLQDLAVLTSRTSTYPVVNGLDGLQDLVFARVRAEIELSLCIVTVRDHTDARLLRRLKQHQYTTVHSD